MTSFLNVVLVITFYQTGPDGLFYFSKVFNLILQSANNYFLCKIDSFGEKHLTQAEIDDFHLSTLKLTYEEAVAAYEKQTDTKLGQLIANRELPVLRYAKELISNSI